MQYITPSDYRILVHHTAVNITQRRILASAPPLPKPCTPEESQSTVQDLQTVLLYIHPPLDPKLYIGFPAVM